MAQPRVNSQHDYVQDQGKLVIQVMKERTAAKDWDKNWGFLKNMRPFLEDEAATQGLTREQYWSAVQQIRPRYAPPTATTSPKPTNRSIPKTSSAMIGWRADQPLERRDPPWVEPWIRDKPQYIIFLG